jgi:hypothetical protein
LLSAHQWIHDLQLANVDFETDSNIVLDSIYDRTLGVSNFASIINDCRRLISSDLTTSDVKFIRRQVNEVTHSLARVAPYHASFRIFI